MTTTAPLQPSPPPAGPAGAPATQGAADSYLDGPGRLRIDPRVVQKLAAQAANEVEGVSRASAGPIGRAIHRPVPASTPQDQLAIDLELAVTIRYPLSLRAVVERLASHVSQRVEHLAGRPVRRISVSVRDLGGSDTGSSRPRVR